MLSEKMGIDTIDCQIMELIQKAPNLTHTEIATHVNRSQPTVGMRIKKLEKLGVLKYQAGINIKVADLIFARIELQTKSPEKAIETVKRCPSMINALRLSGDSILSIFMAGTSLKVLDNIVNVKFRNDPDVVKVHMDIIEDVVNDFVLPIDLNLDDGQLEFTKQSYCCGKCTCHSNFN
ncbi:MAG: Lrp/AsnC family transcriptional regulator [Promethearchaeota archaeon]|jgi:DNA-binding Lrp family transcriptional regulator